MCSTSDTFGFMNASGRRVGHEFAPMPLTALPRQPLIRIFLLTYRRPELLRRALKSLLAQTCPDWICELHNDDPADHSPAEIIAEIIPNDPRLVYHHHSHNWGAIASFNHAFAGGPEPFMALLEDDNWWEPELLATLLDALKTHPEVNLAWANMRIWQEHRDGRWEDTGRTIWPESHVLSERTFEWPCLLQAFDALHSNGAMLCRTGRTRLATVPGSTPFAQIESIRERALDGRLLLISKPLANYSLTIQTARSTNLTLWVQGQLHQAGSFLQAVPLTTETWARLWEHRRQARPRSQQLLFLLALAGVRPREILRHAGLSDWFWFIRGVLRRPFTTIKGLRFRSAQPELWMWLCNQTDRQMARAHLRGFETVPATDLFEKNGS
jgi:glycosyltransferase involved in cell wall biosynthesis